MALTVVCLCADWCNTCGSYRTTFADQAQHHPHDRFEWLDIEDQEDLVGALDITNFPTLLVLADGAPVFAGTITPHPQTLERLCQAARQGELARITCASDWQPLLTHLHKP